MRARIGQKNGLVRQWARRGTRFGAICPARGTGAALTLPFANTEALGSDDRNARASDIPELTFSRFIEAHDNVARLHRQADRGADISPGSLICSAQDPGELVKRLQLRTGSVPV